MGDQGETGRGMQFFIAVISFEGDRSKLSSRPEDSGMGRETGDQQVNGTVGSTSDGDGVWLAALE